MLRGRVVVAAVGGDERVEVGAHDAQLRLQVVRLGEHRLERGDIGVGDGPLVDVSRMSSSS